MNKVLIHFAHPAKSKSKVNTVLRQAVEGLDGITVNDLYTNYPDFMIDVEREQMLCEGHDIIVFQHPFYWYSTPAIVKEWLDLVLEHGWCYGKQGNALAGKVLLQAISAGGDVSSYQHHGSNLHTITELLAPMRATANLCKMRYIAPFCVMGVHDGLPNDKLNAYAKQYHSIICALRDDLIDMDDANRVDFINTDLNNVIRKS